VRWDAGVYDREFGFVTSYGEEILDLLDVRPPAAVIDIGCGTGVHAAALAARGYEVLGVDADPDMLALAAQEYPDVDFLTADVQALVVDRCFDAAVSNAALHWMPEQAGALRAIRGALRPGGQFVAEMGGKHNVETVDGALVATLADMGLTAPPIRKFFPSVAEQAALLEGAGFDISLMQSFPRPTPLAADQTPADWTRLFRADIWDAVPADRHAELAAAIDVACTDLRTPAGWVIDYHRLRFVAWAV